MWQVPRPTLYHAPRRVQIHPVQETDIGTFVGVVQVSVINDLQEAFHAEDGLTDRLDKSILTLGISK